VPQSVKLNPHDGVPILVEIHRPSQDFSGEAVFLDLVLSPGKILVANVLEQSGLARSFGKYARTENLVEFKPLF
jgi:hypothetical protein